MPPSPPNPKPAMTKSTTPPPAAPLLPASATAPAPAADADTNPLDFDGNVDTDNTPPSAATLRKIDNYLVLDRHGKSHTFRSLYTGTHKATRVLVVFVRHFFCGNCQQYLRALSTALPPSVLLALPTPTAICVIGCGDPALIPMYAAASAPAPNTPAAAADDDGEGECPYPIFADPSQRLYDALGMVRTLALGARPKYTEQHILRSSLASIGQGLRQLASGLATKGGDSRQVGGEFLFEPAPGVRSPVVGQEEMWGEQGKARSSSGSLSLDGKGDMGGGVDGGGVDKVVSWCHRMKNTRDHTEVDGLKEVLGIRG